MSHTAFVATIVTSILAFSSPSLAASDEEAAKSGDLMRAAFRCSSYAQQFDLKEEQRLFQIGLKAGRDFVEGQKGRNDPTMGKLLAYLEGASTDFVVGSLYERVLALNPPETKTEAESSYRDNNCSLIQ
jgi:hypothetical protein